MTTYFYGNPEIQAATPSPEGIQTLYLMNPNYLSYSDTPPPPPPQQTSNILFFNPPPNALNPTSISHAPPQSHHLPGIPLPSVYSDDPSRPSSHHGIGILNFQNNMWGQNSAGIGSTVVSVGGQDVRSQTQQGLSLSLSSRQRSIGGEHEIQHHGHAGGGADMRVSRELSPPSVSVASNGVFGSKYLRVVQELLDEVVNIGSEPTKVGNKEKMKMSKESVAQDGSAGAGGTGSDWNSKRAQELTTAQRQELQIKKAKLVGMIDEVDQRYRHYHNQMQLVVSSFEQAAGLGSAKSYTALALQTISKQFRCLKDAISSQIKATNESLGDQDCSGVKIIEGSSRLKYVDHHLRQQRAIQQLEMMQHNPWRPRRGLPERAVSVLRAWLFEHFLHPYPKDSDKVILAKQAGLTRGQVSNWFINARVRLWKPMIEEMYVEETKEQDKNGSADHASASNNEQHKSILGTKARQSEAPPEKLKNQQNPNSSSPTEFSNSTISTSHIGGSLQPQQGFNIIRSAELDGTTQLSTLKKRKGNDIMLQNSPISILSMENKDSSYSLVTNANDDGGGGFGAYFSPEQLGPRFKGNGNVSLTLGLSENNLSSFSASQHNFMSGQNIQLGRLDTGIANATDFFGINNNAQNSHSSTPGLEGIEAQNRKRFVAQLLPDFVA
ncbi:hypothetical protein HS088_TW02G00704 [Tripterygium wilfordii]|uniref:Homeobox domain-containing protein n=1 Tax=Tripterygium wilfordii TaxID=458696 RepID=A0A7J7DZE6_TRIWF|nr:BEL1-like homeodomain protein 1 [Tripterygium wilfordii]XP_038712202.1 BEL1-like homeodomain protein 1 [Tripterygium wilfordii]KAF5751687.1 hypothetical protein HS088_TW02G00704 [Tripterygium wilfordii]